MTSAKFLWPFRDFVPEYHHAKFGCYWNTNKGETKGGGHSVPLPACMVLKDPSLVHVPNFGGCQGRRTGLGITRGDDNNIQFINIERDKSFIEFRKHRGLEGWVATIF